MALKQVLEIYEIVNNPRISGDEIAAFLNKRGLNHVNVHRVKRRKGFTDFIYILIPGTQGKTKKGKRRTLGLIGFLGGIRTKTGGAGIVSDADGALTALAVALKLGDMQKVGDFLDGDVIVTTHICPEALTLPHFPTPFMQSPIDMETMVRYSVYPSMDAIISVDTTRGNRILNRKGLAITPTVKEGFILKVSNDLLQHLENITGQLAIVLPITHQDITAYGNRVYHINSIMQPSIGTTAPVVGLALTSESVVPGIATGCSQISDIEAGARFCIEVAKTFGEGKCEFYDAGEFKILLKLYGPMRYLQDKKSRRPR